MTKILSTFVLISLIRLVSFGDDGCEAYKQQVVSDCNATISNIRLVGNDALSIVNTVNFLKQDNNLSPYFGTLDDISQNASMISGYCVASITSVESIRDTALSLQCTTNSVGSCDCSDKLDEISSTLSEIKDLVDFMEDDTTSILNFLQSDLIDKLNDIGQTFDSLSAYLTNFVSRANVGILGGNTRYYFKQTSGNPSLTQTNSLYPFNTVNFLQNATHESFLRYSLLQFFNTLSSLNNYQYTNIIAQSSIFNTLNKVKTSIDSGTSNVVKSIDNLSSNFNVDSPLSIFQFGDGDYHSFLTNYYVRVSFGATGGSASEPHTNWFSRIEMLLASLVFRDDGSNFVYNADYDSELANIQGEMDTSLDELRDAVDLPEGFERTIRRSGRSFLQVLEGFHDSISGNSLPSTFTLVDINLSNSRSSENLSRLTLETPVSGSFLSFLEVCHAVTTICFTMLFCYWSIKFVIFFCSKIAKCISVCFHVFASLIGSS